MLKRALANLKGVWRDVAGGVALLMVAAALELALPWPIKWLIDSVFGSQALSPLVAWLPGFQAGDSQSAAVMTIVVLIVILGTAHKGLTMLSQLWLIRAGNIMVRDLRLRTMEHLYRLPLSYHDRSKVGDLLYKACYDSYALQTMLSQVFVPVFSGLCVAIGVVIVMLQIDVLLTVVTAATVPLFWLNLKRFEKQMELRSKKFHESESAISSQVQEGLSSIRVIQAFTLEGRHVAHLTEQAGKSVHENMRKSVTELGFSFVIGLLMSVGTAAVVWIGAHAVMDERLFLGDVLVFLAYLGTLYTPLNAFSSGASAYHSATAQLKRVYDLLDEQNTVADRPEARTLDMVRGDIAFRGVSFAYDVRKTAVRKVDLGVGAGEVLALVGATGSGKSTLANLLLRFYDPEEGAVMLDGHDVRDLRLDWLRRQVSIVFQEPMLFSGTIGENIGFGRPDASQADIEAAAKRAQAHEFIAELPDGYGTMLGERGVNLSGGQKQRLSIARAFLKDAPILILDEPTSALDAGTESELLVALEALMKDRTTLIIAHRLSTIRNADQIAVMDGGALAEIGTHAELLRSGGPYRKLHDAQILKGDGS